MRIIVLTYKRFYVNPTRYLFLSEVSEIKGVEIFGKGYRAPKLTIKEMENGSGKFDLVLIDSVYFFGRDTNRMIQMYNAPSMDWPQDLLDYGVPIIVLNLLDDIHGGVKDNFVKLKDSKAFVLSTATSRQFFRQLSAADFARERWLSPHAYVFEHPEVIDDRYLLFPHCVSEQEFIAIDPKRKKYDVSVMGVKYHFRKVIIEYLSHQKDLKTITSNRLRQRILANLATRWNVATSLYYSSFKKAIHNSLVSITCSGTVGYPIRKFFEIPAFGSIVMAEFFDNPEELGFINKENCLYLNEYNLDDMVYLIKTLRRDNFLAQNIAESGQEMIREYHTVKVRVRQLCEIAAALVNGSLQTTRWENGKQLLVMGKEKCPSCS